ncbi:rubrerythrin family protein [Clostridium botulinum]|uniref:rubrerythrin family protein n=1 Tax=Clostridium botulinum TaxID=1491 RepID=UPI0013CB626D|nr:rubrerythrin family protein [Clostridium botulinum]MBN1043222.1 rubrerythrin family protein [Clostridium botulinum]MBY6838524.1 rubrerythrin family protein [Clostridium botulinum]MBY6915145.1 rubrerythrin family protein [Clostridium botulinum]NFG65668.1 rubrerythrin family protein [Clostridium botulinum]NFH91520.1 rubrerythrin family protein [Clostridium botulinum]
MNLKGSKTEKNLYKTFAGECRARSTYNLYAEKARLEGFRWVAKVFDETAENEYAHSREAFKRYLGNVKTTEENLVSAAIGEANETKNIYKEFEDIAREEGFLEIADFYKELRDVEESHEKRYLELAERVKLGILFKCEESCYWKCLNCGYIYEGNEAPNACPLCKYPRAYFEKICEKDAEK